MKVVQEASPDDADNAGLTWELTFPKSSMEAVYLCETARQGHHLLSSAIFDLANVEFHRLGHADLCAVYCKLTASPVGRAGTKSGADHMKPKLRPPPVVPSNPNPSSFPLGRLFSEGAVDAPQEISRDLQPPKAVPGEPNSFDSMGRMC